ncbi:MAG: glycosyl transferase [Methylibium sp. NZG]|nr:MAG: glycosyl transferase [Methylibium sp. NZG]
MAASWWLTGRVRRHALASSLLDHPNERSSHTVPTPRGGGLGVVFPFVALVCALGALGSIPVQMVLAISGGGLLVALVGFLDDRRPLAARWRFGAHCLASLMSLWLMGGIPPVPLFGFDVNLGWTGLALAAVYLVWMVNLYNFMDGVDAIAGVEAVTVALGGALCWWLATGDPRWPLCFAFAACAAGFLVWNTPPARIFMGDAGSGFMGFVLGVLSLWTAQNATQVFWCWFILLGCFVVDATTTLVRRVRRGEKFHQAHRSHAYQYAARRIGSHGKVSLAVGAINLGWLLPLAVLVATKRLDGAAATALAYLPLVWLAFGLRAGDRAGQSQAPGR